MSGPVKPRVLTAVTAMPVALLASLTLGPAPAAAAPTDTILPIPIVGLATGPTGFPGPPVAMHVTARTDPSTPGTTLFLGTEMEYCGCVVLWRNLTTGASGRVDLWTPFAPHPWPTDTAQTGSGNLVATVAAGGAPGGLLVPITILQGGGAWTVP